MLIFLIEYQFFIEKKKITECSFFMIEFCYIWFAIIVDEPESTMRAGRSRVVQAEEMHLLGNVPRTIAIWKCWYHM